MDVPAGRGVTNLQRLHVDLEDVDAAEGRFAQIALVGHRVSGRSA